MRSDTRLSKWMGRGGLGMVAAGAVALGGAQTAEAVSYEWDFSNFNSIAEVEAEGFHVLAAEPGAWSMEPEGIRYQRLNDTTEDPNTRNASLLIDIPELAGNEDFKITVEIDAADTGFGSNFLNTVLAQAGFDGAITDEWSSTSSEQNTSSRNRLRFWPAQSTPAAWVEHIGETGGTQREFGPNDPPAEWHGAAGVHETASYTMSLQGQYTASGLTLIGTITDGEGHSQSFINEDLNYSDVGSYFGVNQRSVIHNGEATDVTIRSMSIVPEPGSLALLAAGGGLMMLRRRG